MAALIDTNIAIALRDGVGSVRLWAQTLGEAPFLSLPSLVELEGGVYAWPDQAQLRRTRLNALLREVVILHLDRAIIAVYGEIVARLGFNRRLIIDRLIAATALRHDMDLVTTNPRDFAPVPGLRVIDWS